MKQLLRFTLLLVLALSGIQFLNSTSKAAVLYPGRGGGGSSSGITNYILSLQLWTNDVDGPVTVLRPINTSRSLLHRQVTTNQYGFYIENQVTNSQTETMTIWAVNKTTNSAAKGAYYWDGAVAGVFESDPAALVALKAGDGVGVLGVADSWWTKQIGIAGYTESVGNTQTNIGVQAASLSNGKSGTVRVGLYAETGVETRSAVTDHPFVSGVIVGDSRTSGDPLLILGTNNGTIKVQVNAAGDPVIANNATTGYVLTSTDGTGLAKWRPNVAIIGPGTNNFLAKFNVVGGTNVGNSPLLSEYSNSVVSISRADGGTLTNSVTNALYGEWTSANNWQRFEMVAAKGHANEANHLRSVVGSGGPTSGNWPIDIADAWSFEPASAVAGHTAYSFSPLVDNVARIGNGSLRVLGMTIGTGNLVVGNSSSQPSITVGSDAGIDGDTFSLSFWRPTTGWTAAFSKERNTAVLQLDLAGNYLGFGTGVSNTISYFRTSTFNNIVQVGTNNADVASPLAAGLMGAQGSGTDHGGSDLKIIGGPSTGTGKTGDVRAMTAEPAAGTSSSVNSSFKDRLIIAARPVTLTESTATLVFNVALASGKFCGLRIMATTDADDGTDFQTTTETIAIAAVNKAGAVSASVSLPAPTASALSSGTLTTTWTAVANGNSVDVKCNAVSSLTQTTLKTRWRVELDGDGTLVTTLQ